MRIALVIARYDPSCGGAERWTDRYALRLAERGHDVHLVVHRFEGARPPFPVHVIQTARGPNRWRLSFADNAAAHLQRHRTSFDVVHDMGDGSWADVFMPHHGTRVANFEATARARGRTLGRWRRLAQSLLPRYRCFFELERRQFAPAGNKLFVAVSKRVRDHMVRDYAVPDDRIRVIHNGIDPDRFRPPGEPERRRAQELRRKLGLEGRTIFLLAAHNLRLKGVESLLRALGSTTTDSHRLALVVVGGGGKMRRYQRLARALDCDEQVRFEGPREDVLPYYHLADVYAHPTYYDTCSLSVLEACGAGLPVITTRQNGASELMTHGVEGCVLDDAGDVPALRAAMRIYLDPAKREPAALAARNLAKRHALERQLERLLMVYEEVQQRRKGVRPRV